MKAVRRAVFLFSALALAVCAFAAPGQAASGQHLSAVGSLYCLVNRAGAGETPVVQSTCAGYADQFWALEPYGSYYHLRNTYTNKCIVTRGTADSGAIVSACGGWADQLWLAPWDGPHRTLVNKNSGKCLTSGTAPEAQPRQSGCTYGSLQQWDFF